MTRRGNLIVGLTDRELAAGHRLTELLYSDDPRVRNAVETALADLTREDALSYAEKLRGTLAYQALELRPARPR